MTAETGQAVDPVCDMTVNTAAAETDVYQGRKYFFCSPECHATFIAAPDAFAASADSSPSQEHRHKCC